MKASAIVAFACLPSFLGQVLAGDAARRDEPVVISEGKRVPSPIHLLPYHNLACQVGKRAAIFLSLVHRGKRLPDLRIPLTPMITGEPLMKIKVTNQDGAEAATYPETRVALYDASRFPPRNPPYLRLLGGQWFEVCGPQFIPWEPGEYSYRLEISNGLTHAVYPNPNIVRIGDSTVWIPRESVFLIPNVWVGRLVIESSFTVREGPSEELKKTLEQLKAKVLDPDTQLSESASALESLVEMRHIHATDTLIAIEEKVRERRAETLHLLVVKALYDITHYGTGYRALRVFADIALDPHVTPVARVLAVHVLLTFRRSEALSQKGQVFHIVRAEEREFAEKMLRKVAMTELPPDARAALNDARLIH